MGISLASSPLLSLALAGNFLGLKPRCHLHQVGMNWWLSGTIFSLAGAIWDCYAAIFNVCDNVLLKGLCHHQAPIWGIALPLGASVMPVPLSISIQPVPLDVNQSPCCCAIVCCLNHLVIALLCAAWQIVLFYPALPEAFHCNATVHCLQHCVVVPPCTNILHFICDNGRQARHVIITLMGADHKLEAVHKECIHASSMLQFNLFGQRNYEYRAIHSFGWRNCECCAATSNSFGRCNYKCSTTIHSFGRRNCGCCTMIPHYHSQCNHYFICPIWQLGDFHEKKVHRHPPPQFFLSFFVRKGRPFCDG
jgi:hypothetical protein